MRALLKLIAACLIAVAIQGTIAMPPGTADEIRFTGRVCMARLLGAPLDDPALLAAADELKRNELDRVVASQGGHRNLEVRPRPEVANASVGTQRPASAVGCADESRTVAAR